MVEIKFITGETEVYVLHGNSGYCYDKETELFRLETEQGTITIPREVIRTIQFSKKIQRRIVALGAIAKR